MMKLWGALDGLAGRLGIRERKNVSGYHNRLNFIQLQELIYIKRENLRKLIIV